MEYRVLIVDDEINLLNGLKRHFRKKIAFDTALGSKKALELLKSNHYCVLVTDYRMPEINGVELLKMVQHKYPEIIRVMLTGNADQQTAIEAVNEGHVFKFLSKPCSSDEILSMIKLAIERYKINVAENLLLEKTLKGTINMLTDLIAQINSSVYGRSIRIKKIVEHSTSELRLRNKWEYEIAGMLSLLGTLTFPNELLTKIYLDKLLSEEETSLYSEFPNITYRLLSKIPRLRNISIMIRGQLKDYNQFPENDKGLFQDRKYLGAQILRIALEIDNLTMKGVSWSRILAYLKANSEKFNPLIVKSVETFKGVALKFITKELYLKDVKVGMITAEKIYSLKGTVLLSNEQEITNSILESLYSFAAKIGIKQPFTVKLALYD